jgi:hypothetical protein
MTGVGAAAVKLGLFGPENISKGAPPVVDVPQGWTTCREVHSGQ